MKMNYCISMVIFKESNFEKKRKVVKEYIYNDFIYVNY